MTDHPVPLTGSLCRCSACERTFRSVAAFDAHRPDRGGCGDPVAAGLVEHAGIWATPEGHARRELLAERARTMRRTAHPGAQSAEPAPANPEVPHG